MCYINGQCTHLHHTTWGRGGAGGGTEEEEKKTNNRRKVKISWVFSGALNMIYPEIEHKHHNKHTCPPTCLLFQTFSFCSFMNNRQTKKTCVSMQSVSEIDVNDIYSIRSFRLCFCLIWWFLSVWQCPLQCNEYCLSFVCLIPGSAFKLIVKFSLMCSVYDFLYYLFILCVCGAMLFLPPKRLWQ